MRGFECRTQRFIGGIPSGIEFGLRNAHLRRVEFGPVKFLGEFEHGGITTLTHGLDDARDDLTHGVTGLGTAVEGGGSVGVLGISGSENFHQVKMRKMETAGKIILRG
jgi:hypothetical protein